MRGWIGGELRGSIGCATSLASAILHFIHVEIKESVEERPALHFCYFAVFVLFLDFDLGVRIEGRGRSTYFIMARILGGGHRIFPGLRICRHRLACLGNTGQLDDIGWNSLGY
jgi:hypothetical protein